MSWFIKVKVGDKLRPQPDWNRTERNGNQLPDTVEILRVMKATSQSGVLFTVRTRNGQERNLDAAWFMMPNAKVSGGGKAPPPLDRMVGHLVTTTKGN